MERIDNYDNFSKLPLSQKKMETQPEQVLRKKISTSNFDTKGSLEGAFLVFTLVRCCRSRLWSFCHHLNWQFHHERP